MRVNSLGINSSHQPQTTRRQGAGQQGASFADMLTKAQGVGESAVTVPPEAKTNSEPKVKIGEPVKVALTATAEAIESPVPTPTYPDSITDLSPQEMKAKMIMALQVINDAGMDGELEGKTNTEKYNFIKSVFSDFLGKDFLDTHLINMGFKQALDWSEGSHARGVDQVFGELRRALKNFGFDPAPGSADMIEARGLTGMSESEKRAAVRAQFPENMTFRDVMLMTHEFNRVGVETFGGVQDAIVIQLGILEWSPLVQSLLDAILDSPADYAAMSAHAHAFHAGVQARTDGIRPSHSVSGVMDGILRWFGGQHSQALAAQIRGILNEMEAIGQLTFNQFGDAAITRR